MLAAPPLAIVALRSSGERGFAVAAAIISGMEVLLLASVVLWMIVR